VASDQKLVQATACAIIDRLSAGEVTPLDLLDVLEQRIAEVDGKVNALPTLCFRSRPDPRPLSDEKSAVGRW
jgi:amidase